MSQPRGLGKVEAYRGMRGKPQQYHEALERRYSTCHAPRFVPRMNLWLELRFRIPRACRAKGPPSSTSIALACAESSCLYNEGRVPHRYRYDISTNSTGYSSPLHKTCQCFSPSTRWSEIYGCWVSRGSSRCWVKCPAGGARKLIAGQPRTRTSGPPPIDDHKELLVHLASPCLKAATAVHNPLLRPNPPSLPKHALLLPSLTPSS
nr:hypothetical protein CFP56_09399 [Quercus suber]